jgi:plasmid stabilization system protein ParE
VNSFDYLEEQGGLDLAGRFLSAIETTFEALSQVPKAGTVCSFRTPPASSSPLTGKWF